MEERVKSTHQAELVKIEMTKIENAETLSVVPVYGYNVVIKSELWEGIAYGIWFPPDVLLDTTRPEFIFLHPDAKYAEDGSRGGSYARIKAKKIRGTISYGVMIPATSEDSSLSGEELFIKYGAKRYEPPMNTGGGKNNIASGGEACSGPGCYHVKYDVDSLQRYAHKCLTEGEPVFVTEKIHGANGRWVFHNGEFYCGSRTEWKREYALPPDVSVIEARMRANAPASEELELRIEAIKKKVSEAKPSQNMWWKGLRAYPKMVEFLQNNPDTLVYGEVYGAVQDLRYGVPNGEVRIGVFDLMKDGRWLDPDEARKAGEALPWVPTISEAMPYNLKELLEIAEGNSRVPGAENQLMEGVVVSPIKERNDPHLGRVKLKIVSLRYLDKK